MVSFRQGALYRVGSQGIGGGKTGYSRLIGLDDAGTLERLRALRDTLIDPAIAEHGGRIVQTGGNSLLVTFDSIDGAVRCATEVQQKLPIHDGDQPPEKAIRFRIGINIGDAIADGTDLHGDAVNIAARLQAECPPGAICVSRSVREHVHSRLGLIFEALGILNLKNIAKPVEAFLLRPRVAPTNMSLVHATGDALPLPDKPSIAVLAFTNMSGEPEQEYFSDGIADDIITELSRSRLLFVIARNSSFSYKSRTIDIKQAARELGMRYVLEGSVRRSGARVRVTAQLIDAESRRHIWADRYDRSVEDVFEVQDQITAAVTNAIEPAISRAEQQRAVRKPLRSLDAWETYQRGMWHLAKFNLEEVERAQFFYRRATELAPLFAAPHAMIGLVGTSTVGMWGNTEGLDKIRQTAEAEARIAIDLDPELSGAHGVLAWAAARRGDHAEGLEHAATALALNANDVATCMASAQALTFGGRAADAREALLGPVDKP